MQYQSQFSRNLIKALLAGCLSLAATQVSADGFQSINTNAVLGGAIGGGAGAAVGSAVGGRNGAMIGSAVGAVAGVAIATPQGSREYREYDDEHDRGWHHKHSRHGHHHDD